MQLPNYQIKPTTKFSHNIFEQARRKVVFILHDIRQLLCLALWISLYQLDANNNWNVKITIFKVKSEVFSKIITLFTSLFS